MAIIVDSKLTLSSQTDQACTVAGGTGCKAVLVRKDVLLVITGVFNDPVNGQNWQVTTETRKLLAELPATVTLDALRDFTHKWFDIVVNHYRAKPSLDLPAGRIVSELTIGTHINGAPYIAQIEVRITREGRFTESWAEPQLSALPRNFYSGSCRDYVGTNDVGGHHAPANPPDPELQTELNILGLKKFSAKFPDDLVPVMEDYERLFERIANTKNQCWIGPPYDVATWARDDEGWIVNFKKACQVGASQAVPVTHPVPRGSSNSAQSR